MRRAVVLKHTELDQTYHFDFLIDQPELRVEHRLICFKSLSRPDLRGEGIFTAHRIPDHRTQYLTYEGSISGDRGSVCRVAQGAVKHFNLSSNSLKMLIQWDDSTIEYCAELIDSECSEWAFQCEQR